MHLIYSTLFTIAVILAAPLYLWRRRDLLRSSAWRERLGHLPEAFQQNTREASERAIWVHAVSVGETIAAAGLVRELYDRYPERPIFMSHVTPTGRATGDHLLPAVATLAGCGSPPADSTIGSPTHAARGPKISGRFYLPLDWNFSVKRAFRRIRPALLVIIETELWPNFIRVAGQYGARIAIVNARLSERSFRGYKRFGHFFRPVLAGIDVVCAQTDIDADRFRHLGVPAGRITVTGNLKFDASPPQIGQLPRVLSRALAAAARGPVMVAASTMPGEEPLVLEAWRPIHQRFPRAILVLAPRHPERAETVMQLLKERNVSYVLRSDLKSADREVAGQVAQPEVLVLNTLGELAGTLERADIVFVGGSLVPTGGHNILEAAFWSKAIIFGPHMQNFQRIAEMFVASDAAVPVRDADELSKESIRLLENPELREAFGSRARKVFNRESGATRRTVDCIEPLLIGAVPERQAARVGER
jgi:3-deoxy-D-manno-octulosonic-acid transferase